MKHLPFLCLVCAALLTAVTFADDRIKVDLKDGDRVAFIGNTFVEREQIDGYIETMFTSQYPDRNITFRNLGYSADTVTGSARGLCTGWSTFENADKAFDRLRKLVAEFKPTVLLMNYGMTESFSGPDGIRQFTDNYNKMLDALSAAAGTSPRIILMSPNYHEDLGRPLPDPTDHNKNLKLYSEAIESIAHGRNAVFIDLLNLTDPGITHVNVHLTSNGIHLTPIGYWIVAQALEGDATPGPYVWRVAINAGNLQVSGEGTKISNVAGTETGIAFSAVDDRLPSPPAPQPNVASRDVHRLQILGLKPGDYELKAGEQSIAKAEARQWASGVDISPAPLIEQAEALRKTIVAKNFDFFNYQRPDNDAYILAFRRGEQGRNAVEIPRFLPLVIEKEKQIATLRAPKLVAYTLQPAK